MAFTIFVTGGNTAKAAGLSNSPGTAATSGDCGCHVTIITGKERNKLVSHLLKTHEFKTVKKNAKKEGYSWNGAHDIQVIRKNDTGEILIGVPFTDPNGNVVMFVFNKDGHFLGTSPAN